METLALLAGILTAIVFVAERLAFAVIVYMLSRWTLRLVRPWLVRLLAILLIVRAWCASQIMALQRWWALRALRSQLSRGATP